MAKNDFILCVLDGKGNEETRIVFRGREEINSYIQKEKIDFYTVLTMFKNQLESYPLEEEK